MTLHKMQRMNSLYDFYHCLLTDKQNEIISYYYLENYSYSEIGEILNISRSAVYDTIKKSEHLLEEYEEKLKLYQNYKSRLEYYNKLKALNIEEVSLIVEKCLNTE